MRNMIGAAAMLLMTMTADAAEVAVVAPRQAGVGMDEPLGAPAAPSKTKSSALDEQYVKQRQAMTTAVEEATSALAVNPASAEARVRLHGARARLEQLAVAYNDAVVREIEGVLAGLEGILSKWRNDPDAGTRQTRLAEVRQKVDELKARQAASARLAGAANDEAERGSHAATSEMLRGQIGDLEGDLAELISVARDQGAQEAIVATKAVKFRELLEQYRFVKGLHVARRNAQALLGIEWNRLRERRLEAERVTGAAPTTRVCTLGCK